MKKEEIALQMTLKAMDLGLITFLTYDDMPSEASPYATTTENIVNMVDFYQRVTDELTRAEQDVGR